jgi:hypothetical protein
MSFHAVLKCFHVCICNHFEYTLISYHQSAYNSPCLLTNFYMPRSLLHEVHLLLSSNCELNIGFTLHYVTVLHSVAKLMYIYFSKTYCYLKFTYLRILIDGTVTLNGEVRTTTILILSWQDSVMGKYQFEAVSNCTMIIPRLMRTVTWFEVST